MALDYVYHYDGLGGFPIHYVRPADEPPFLTEADYQTARGEKAGDYGAYLNHIVIDDTRAGYLQFVALMTMGGQFYLFYSGNGYYGAAYAVGVARASAPLGPYAKAPAPIVVTKGPWVGPGHNSIVTTPSGEDWMVYHAWKSGQVNGPGDGRVLLIDRVLWQGGWPATGHAPSSTSLPTP